MINLTLSHLQNHIKMSWNKKKLSLIELFSWIAERNCSQNPSQLIRFALNWVISGLDNLNFTLSYTGSEDELEKGSNKPYTCPHLLTLTHTRPKNGHIHQHPLLVTKRSFPPKSSRKSMKKKFFHYPLVNEIYHKLIKS